MKRFLLFALAIISTSQAAPPHNLTVGPRSGLETRESGGVWSFRTTGANPHFWTSALPITATPETHPILSFEYFSTADIKKLTVRIPRTGGSRHFSAGMVPLAETWHPFSIDLRLAEVPYASGPGNQIALILGTEIGHQFQIRNLQLRAPNQEEQRSAREREATRRLREEDAAAYLAYLKKESSTAKPNIRVGRELITIAGQLPKNGYSQFGVIEFQSHHPSHHSPPGKTAIEAQSPWKPAPYELAVPRFANQRDRAMSRWQLVGIDEAGRTHPLSPATYPTMVDDEAIRTLPQKQAKSFKGLGGIPALDPNHEIFELGIHHATVNIVLNGILSHSARPKWKPWRHERTTWFLNPALLNRIDHNIRLLTERDIVVSAILLVGNGRNDSGTPVSTMVHPEALAMGKFAMPNLATPEGASAYRAVIHLLTERYTRENEEYGRVSNWIIHNEVDQSGTWTTMGEQPLPRYLETYLRSARLVHHSAGRYDEHARVFISLTHHWTKQSGGPQTYVVRDMVELFAEAARVEGDFNWGLAYHPYPQPMRQPDVWNNEVTHDFATEYITPRNLEVLTTYFDQPQFHFQGKPRGILLSEQGINALSLSPEDQRMQAAGIAYTMRKVALLPQVEAYHYHAYQDSPAAEGGLLLGLRHREHGRKLAWDVYGSLGTECEAETTRFAWPIIGIDGPEAVQLTPVSR
tara:strand:- start:629 stop:2707 length:2079 start_codon:yes stop_codon:yes gene_type:complete